MRLAFLYGPEAFGVHRPPIDLTRLDARPLTGTDLVSTKLPLEMAKRGHHVALYMDRAAPACVEGVHTHPFTEWTDWTAKNFDAVIATSNPNALSLAPTSAARIVNRQVARFGIDCAPGWQTHVDLVTCPSAWARDYVRGGLGDDAPRFDVLPSGCDVTLPEVDRVPGRCAYCSSPDRGLHWLLQAWPHIRRAAPRATLRIFYESIGSWLATHTRHRAPIDALDEEQIRRAHYIHHALARLKAHGVECVPGGITHEALGHELAQAEALLYPLDPLAPTETFGVAVLEAQAAGCVPVLSDADAFGELWGSSSACVAAPVGSRITEWTDLAIRTLTDADYRRERSEAARANAARYSWGAAAERLESLIADTLARKRAPVVELVRSEPLTIHAVLTGYASGNVPMDPERPFEASVGGGCRTGFVQLARGLAARGHHVRAFSTWSREATASGVECRMLGQASTFVANAPDVLLAYYDTSPVSIPARVTVASHHTYAVPFPASIPLATLNTAPSEHAARAVAACHGGRWAVLPNIVPPELPPRATKAGRVLYHTSPDRGLHRLLAMWPEIRRRVPGVTLHVVGDVEGWASRMRTERCTQGDRARRLLSAMPAAMDAGGIELLGRLSRAEVHRELSDAAAVALPFDPPAPCETWSTTIAESMAVGVPVVMTPCGALGDLWGDVALVGESDRDFIDALESVLTEPKLAEHVSERQRRKVETYTADHAAKVLEEAIGKCLGEGKARAA